MKALHAPGLAAACITCVTLTGTAAAQTKVSTAVNKITVSATQGTPPANQARLPETLRKLDAASLNFHSATADFYKDFYTKLVNDTERQDGSLYIERGKGSTEAGIRLTGRDATIVNYRNGTAKVFNPKTACYNTVSGNRGGIESFLTLGFGGSGTELMKAWDIQDLGTENLKSENKMVPVERLELVPRDPAIKNNFVKIEIWVDLADGISLQQKSYSPSGDTQTAYYSKIQVNQSVKKDPFQFKGKECGK